MRAIPIAANHVLPAGLWGERDVGNGAVLSKQKRPSRVPLGSFLFSLHSLRSLVISGPLYIDGVFIFSRLAPATLPPRSLAATLCAPYNGAIRCAAAAAAAAAAPALSPVQRTSYFLFFRLLARKTRAAKHFSRKSG